MRLVHYGSFGMLAVTDVYLFPLHLCPRILSLLLKMQDDIIFEKGISRHRHNEHIESCLFHLKVDPVLSVFSKTFTSFH